MSSAQYIVFRAIFGTYLIIHFVQLVPWGGELFSDRGVLAVGSTSPLLYVFPNVLAVWDAPTFVVALLVFAAAASVAFALGFYDRAASLALWYVLACLFGRNPLIGNPALPYIGILLLANACLPRSPESWPDGRMPQEIHRAVWVLMALGYSYSGYTKLSSPSWLDGTALERILHNPLARPGTIREALLALPPALTQAATWGTLGLELFFAPLALIRGLRPWLWTGMLALHLALIVLIDFANLSIGMVMLQLFTFDPEWMKRKARCTNHDGIL